MARPKLKELAYMLGVYSNKTIPQTYINEFSNYELLLALLSKINEIIERCNIYTDAIEEISKLLDDLDATIKEEIEKVLNEMYESGEFDEVLADVLNNYFSSATAPKEFRIDTRREFRIARPVMPYNTTTVNGEWYSYCQGGKMFKRMNTLYYVCCLKPSRSDNSYYNNDNVDIRLYQYNNLDDKWEFVRNNIYSFGHGNDICYVDKMDKFIVTYGTEYDTNQHKNVQVKKWAIIDFSLPNDTSLTITNPSVFEEDSEGGITAIDYYDNKLWFGQGAGSSGSTIRIDVLEVPDEWQSFAWVMNTPEKYARFNVPTTAETTYTMVMAGFCQNEHFIFFGNTAPSGIYRFNKTTKSVDCFYEIGNYTNNHMYPTGEMENLSCIDDILYIGTSIHGNQELWYYDYTQVFSFDFINNLNVPNKVATSYGGTYRIINLGTQYYTLDIDNNKVYAYDDNTINSAIREISNPNGLEGENGEPFPTWEEAFLFINAQEIWHDITIRQKTRYMVEYVCITSNKNIFIDGSAFYNSHKVEGEPDNPLWYARMGGLYIDGTNIAVSNMWIQNLSPLSLIAYSRQQVFIRNSNCAFHSSVFYVTGRSELQPRYDNVLFNINRSFMNLSYNKPVIYNSSTQEFEFGNNYIYSQTEQDEDTSQYYLKYLTVYQCTINAFNHYTANEHTTNFDGYFVAHPSYS